MESSLLTRQRARKLELERFLCEGLVEGSASSDIVDSWRRCRLEGLRPDQFLGSFDPDDVDAEHPFLRAASPILDRLAERLSNTGTSAFLTDGRARIIWRWVDAPDLRRRLDKVNCDTGFWFAEHLAGTNGVGTVIACGHPVEVIGADHFVEALDAFACIGAPIRNPISQRIEGVLDITVNYRRYNPLILPLVVEAAQTIEDRLYATAARSERVLLEHFLTANRRSTHAVISMSDDIVIANPAAARLVEAVDKELLWERAAGAIAERSDAIHHLVLGNGQSISARCRPVNDRGSIVGALIEIESLPASKPRQRRGTRRPPLEDELPGLVGRSQAWDTLRQRALGIAQQGLPVLVIGEPGIGKVALLKAMARFRGIKEISVFDAAERMIHGEEKWLRAVSDQLRAGSNRLVVIRHLEALEQLSSEGLVVLLDEVLGVRGADRPWIAGTVSTAETRHVPIWPPLYDRLAATRLDIPPLRERPEDIVELFQYQLAQHAGRATPCRPEVLHLLQRLEWPGNAREVGNVAWALVRAAGSAEIRLDHLPNELRSQGGRRALTKMERAELETISRALAQVGGNRRAAAKVLGISRATLYRKLRAYGFELDRRAF